MTDNEKRAHDLAVAIAVASTFSNSALSRIYTNTADTEEIKLDLYAVYKDTYESALSSLARDFPNGN